MSIDTIIKLISVFLKLYQVVSDLYDLPFKLLGVAMGIPVTTIPLFVIAVKFVKEKLETIVI